MGKRSIFVRTQRRDKGSGRRNAHDVCVRKVGDSSAPRNRSPLDPGFQAARHTPLQRPPAEPPFSPFLLFPAFLSKEQTGRRVCLTSRENEQESKRRKRCSGSSLCEERLRFGADAANVCLQARPVFHPLLNGQKRSRNPVVTTVLSEQPVIRLPRSHFQRARRRDATYRESARGAVVGAGDPLRAAGDSVPWSISNPF